MVSFPRIVGDFDKVVVQTATVIAWVAVFGNSLVLWALLSSKKSGNREITILIICAQATADLVSGLLTGTFGIFSSYLNHFPGQANMTVGINFYSGTYIWRGPWCTLYGYFLHLVCFTSIGTLVLISWERYCSIARPLKSRLSKTNLFKLCAAIWAFGLLFAAIPALKNEYVLHEPGAFCYRQIGPNTTSTLTCMFILLFSACICALYSRMYKHVVDAFKGTMKSKETEVSIQFLTIIICFLACWLPAGIDFFLGMIGNKVVNEQNFVLFIRPLSYVLCTGNSAVNPLLYIFMNKKVKRIVSQRVWNLGKSKKRIHLADHRNVIVIRILVQGKDSRTQHSRCLNN